MRREALLAVVWKDVRTLVRMVWPVPFLICAAVVFGAMFGSRHRGGEAIGAAAVVMFMAVYFFTDLLFFRERLNRTFDNLFASPLTLQEIFLGKVIVCFVLSFAATALAVVSFTAYRLVEGWGPPLAIQLLISLIEVPVLGLVLIELFCSSYLWLRSKILGWVGLAGFVVLVGPWGGSARLAAVLSQPAIPTLAGLVVALLLYLLIGLTHKGWVARIMS